MKYVTKIFALVLVLVLMMSLAISVNAAVIVTEPAKTVELTIEFFNARAIDGDIVFSDPSIIKKVEYDTSKSGMSGLVEDGMIFMYSDNPNGVTGKIVVRVTLASNAAKGSSCNVTFHYAVTRAGEQTPGAVQTEIHTILIPENTNDPIPEVIVVDTSSLLSQIRYVLSLDAQQYTQDSWDAVELALEDGLNAMKSSNQTTIDNATQAIRDAVADLVLMDYDALQEAIFGTGDIQGLEELAAPWTRFVAAMNAANKALTCGDQEVVDAAIVELLASRDALIAALEKAEQPVYITEIVEVEVEKLVDQVVEVVPENHCNKVVHTALWVLLILSWIVSMVLTGLVIGYIVYRSVKKARSRRDDTPLVDYNIEDDAATGN